MVEWTGPRDTIAAALEGHRSMSRVTAADAVLSALTQAGYTVARLEAVPTALTDEFRAVITLQSLVTALRHEPGFSALTCSGALFTALGVAEHLLHQFDAAARVADGSRPA